MNPCYGKKPNPAMQYLYGLENRLKMLVRNLGWKPTQKVHSEVRSLLECDCHDLGLFVWRRLLPLVGTTPFPPDEIMLMSAAVLHVKPDVIIEWGTNIGVSARIFFEVSRAYGLEVDTHSIDLPPTVDHPEHPHRRRGFLVRHLPVTLHEGDGPEVAKSLLAKARRPLVFIDGDHQYTSVLRDGRAVIESAPAAAILFHDTFFQPGARYNHGPHEAVRTIVQELEGRYQVLEASLGLPGMTLLLPRGA
jgi:predicted O-methyltransferase YrrM